MREAVDAGVNHIDTSDFYGPHIVNRIIHNALHPYPENLVLVTKVGFRRGADKSWIPATSRSELTTAIHDNLRHLEHETLDIVNLRLAQKTSGEEADVAEPLAVLMDLQRQGFIRHIGISNATANQVRRAQKVTDIIRVQNEYNLVRRDDDELIDEMARLHVAYTPFFPLGGFSPLQSATRNQVAESAGSTPMQVALACLLKRSPNILLINGTTNIEHLRENLNASQIKLEPEELEMLDSIGRKTAR